MRFLKIKALTILTLTLMLLCMGVFSLTAYASGGATLTVNAAWVDGELLRINVTDADGVSSALALRLSDYVSDAENKEYISIQAVDLAGNKSEVIEIKNPFYDPTAAPLIITAPSISEQPKDSQSAAPESDGTKPFTPDGTGTVIDNANDGDGKEFFTIGTEDGSVFYLIVDRQRNADNVYLLNSVTLDDLVALADKSGATINTNPNGSTSAVETPEQPNTAEEQNERPPTTSSPDPAENPTESSEQPPAKKSDGSMYILIGIAVVAAGGLGYYFKIVKGRKNAPDDGDDEDDDYFGLNGESEEDSDDDYADTDPEDGGDE